MGEVKDGENTPLHYAVGRRTQVTVLPPIFLFINGFKPLKGVIPLYR